jgi:hypothetical protein
MPIAVANALQRTKIRLEESFKTKENLAGAVANTLQRIQIRSDESFKVKDNVGGEVKGSKKLAKSRMCT